MKTTYTCIKKMIMFYSSKIKNFMPLVIFCTYLTRIKHDHLL